MKKMVKIVLITVLVALPALGTYVKTTLPKPGFATDWALERTAERIESGNCRQDKMAASIHCNNKENWSEFANPIPGGASDFNRSASGDFPVNFLFNIILFEEEFSIQGDLVENKDPKYLTAPML